MTDQPTLRPVITPAERCGQWSPGPLGARTECVLRPDHSGSHADNQGGRWWPNPAWTTPDNPATSSDTTDNPLREQISAAMIRVLAPNRHLVTPEEFRVVDELTPAVMAAVKRDRRVLADEVTRLSAITGQLRTLATRWQATVRPGETHPAAAAILNILDDDGPSVREAAADDRAHWTQKYAGE